MSRSASAIEYSERMSDGVTRRRLRHISLSISEGREMSWAMLRGFETLPGEDEADYVGVEVTLKLMIVGGRAQKKADLKLQKIGHGSLHELKFIDDRTASLKSIDGYRELVTRRQGGPECREANVVQLASTIEEKRH